MKNRKGFTLVELLVAIVIIGIIGAMSWPVITRVQESNEISKYKKYGEALVAAAKLYIDSYEEDLFYYDDDLDDDARERGQCAYITYNELTEHQLIKDYAQNGVTCNSESTFVKVLRKKGKYKYTYYLGCGYAHEDGSQLKNDTEDIFYTYPIEGKKNYPDPATCSRTVTENEPPVITYMYVRSRGTSYNGNNVSYTLEAVDNDTEIENLKYCVSLSDGECTDYQKFNNSYSATGELSIPGEIDGSLKTIYFFIKDLNNNVTTGTTTYRFYKKCNYVRITNKSDVTECSKPCGTGTKTVKYDKYDYYFSDHLCGTVNSATETCNTFSCCSKVTRTCQPGEDIDSSQCDNACVGSNKLQFAICDDVSVYTGESCGVSSRAMQFVSCNSTVACNSTNMLYNPIFTDNNSSSHTRTCKTNPSIGEVRCTSRNGDNYLYALSVTGISSTYARLTERIYDMETGEIICQNNGRSIQRYFNCMDNTRYRKNVMYVGYIYDSRTPTKKSANTYYQLLENYGVENDY